MTERERTEHRPLAGRVGADPRGRRELTLAARRFRSKAKDDPSAEPEAPEAVEV